MRFYINPQGLVSLPVNFGYFYKFTLTSGPYLAIEEVTNGASGPTVFAGLVDNMSEDDVFKMCFFAADAEGRKKHKRNMFPALRWVMKNLWRATLDSPPIGSTFSEQGVLNVLGKSSDELIDKVSEAIVNLSATDTVNHDVLISVTVSRSVARNPTAPEVRIAVRGDDAEADREKSKKPKGQVRPSSDAATLRNSNTNGRRSCTVQGKRAGTPQPEEDDD